MEISKSLLSGQLEGKAIPVDGTAWPKPSCGGRFWKLRVFRMAGRQRIGRRELLRTEPGELGEGLDFFKKNIFAKVFRFYHADNQEPLRNSE